MTRYHKPSIRETGLKDFLNRSFPMVLGLHSATYTGIAYKVFVGLVEAGVNSTNIGKVYGRSPGAIDSWKAILREEEKTS